MSDACNVDVWLISLESDRAPVLSPDEEIRAARFRFPGDRTRWVRSRTALRTILSEYCSLPPLDLAFVLGAHGKPALAGDTGIEFSLSHSGSWAAVAVARGVETGIDIERIREGVNMSALLQRLGEKVPAANDASQLQSSLFRYWVRREAMTKAVGSPLLEPPPASVRVVDLHAPEGYAAAVALVGHEPEIRIRSLVPSSGTI